MVSGKEWGVHTSTSCAGKGEGGGEKAKRKVGDDYEALMRWSYSSVLVGRHHSYLALLVMFRPAALALQTLGRAINRGFRLRTAIQHHGTSFIKFLAHPHFLDWHRKIATP